MNKSESESLYERKLTPISIYNRIQCKQPVVVVVSRVAKHLYIIYTYMCVRMYVYTTPYWLLLY